ncbi:MAG: ribonuclease P protein component [SAR202 cluster bacterium]|nr:ribonuclease P protein component [SAR202 cluster bacterium]
MPRERRLTKSSDFGALRAENRSWSDRLLVLRVKRNGLGVSRAGFSVGKRIGNAVTRNRAKRRMREAVRLTPVQQGWDFVFIARNGVVEADFKEICSSVESLLKRAGLLARAPAPPPGEAGIP